MFNRVFHYFHHPFWVFVPPIFGSTPINTPVISISIPKSPASIGRPLLPSASEAAASSLCDWRNPSWLLNGPRLKVVFHEETESPLRLIFEDFQ